MTVQEIEAKKVKLEAELNMALTAAKVLTPATAEFDEAYGRYLAAKAAIACIPDEIAKAKLSENAAAIAAAGASIAEAIIQVAEGLKVAQLLGKPVNALSFYMDAAGKAMVVFNPVTRVTSPGRASDKKDKGAGHTMIVGPDGTRYSLTKFVLAFATEAEKATPEYKYPHAQVASKPKFEAFCTAHNLTGYVYETPGKAGTESAS